MMRWDRRIERKGVIGLCTKKIIYTRGDDDDDDGEEVDGGGGGGGDDDDDDGEWVLIKATQKA